jgi:hypothetical protein
LPVVTADVVAGAGVASVAGTVTVSVVAGVSAGFAASTTTVAVSGATSAGVSVFEQATKAASKIEIIFFFLYLINQAAVSELSSPFPVQPKRNSITTLSILFLHFIKI